MANNIVTVTYILNDKISRQLKLIQKTSGYAEAKIQNLDNKIHKLATSKDPTKFATNVTRSLDRVNKALNNTTGGFKSMQGTVKNTYTQQQRMANVFDNATNSIKAQHKESVSYTRSMNQGINSMNKSTGVANKYSGVLDKLRNNERKLRQESDGKTASVKEQSKGFSEAGKSGNKYNGTLGRLTANESRYRATLKEVADYSFFEDGFSSGARMFQTTSKLLAVLPLLGTAAGGAGQMINGLVAAAAAAGGSLVNLAGILGALPGLFAAGGVAALGLSSIMGAIVEPSMKNVPKLEDAQERVSEATQRISDAQQKVTDVQDKINSAQRDLAEAADLSNEGGETVDEYNRILKLQDGMKSNAKDLKDAQSGVAEANREAGNAQKDYNDLAKQTPSRAKELFDEVQKTKTAWMQLWQNAGSGGGIMDLLIEGLKFAQSLMKVFAPQADHIVDAFVRMGNVLMKVFSDPAMQKWVGDSLDMAIANFEAIFNTAIKFLPLFTSLLTLSQEFTGTLLDELGIWGSTVNEASNVETVVASIGAWMDRGLASFKNWAKILANFGVAFNNVFQAANPQRFEKDLLGVARTFRNWTETNTDGITAFMDRSYTVFKALGRLVLSVAKAFGVLSTKASTGETVAFLDQLGRGIIAFAGYAERSIKVVGPQLRAFFSELGEAMGGNLGNAMIQTTANVLKFAGSMLKLFNSIPTPILVFLVQMRIYMLAFGFAAGAVVGPLFRFGSIIDNAFIKLAKGEGLLAKIVPKFKSFYKVLAGGRGGLMGFTRAFGIVGLAIGVVMGMVDAFRSNFGGIKDSIEETVTGLKDQLGPAFARLGEAIGGKGGFGAALKFIGSALGSIFKVIGAVVLKVVQFAAIFLGGVIGGVINIITLIVNQFKLAWEFWKTFVGAIANGDFKGAMGAVWDYIKGTFSNIGSFIGNMWSNTMDMMTNLLAAVGTSIVGFIAMPFENAINNVIDTLNTVINTTNKLLGTNMDTVSKVTIVTDYIDGQNKKREDKRMGEIAKENAAPKSEQSKDRLARASGGERGRQMARVTAARGVAAKPKPKPKAVAKGVQGLTTTKGVPGYTQTGAQGAEVKWNAALVKSFNNTTNDIGGNFVTVSQKALNVPKHVTTGINKAIAAMTSKEAQFAAAATSLAVAFYTPFHFWLTKAVDEVNKVVEAAGGTPINVTGGSTTVRTGGASSGGGGAQGDAGANSNPNPFASLGASLGAAVGNIVNQGQLKEMQPAAAKAVMDILGQFPGQKTITAVKSNHGKYTASGNISDHWYGLGVDIDAPDPELNKMGAYARANAGRFGAKPDQIFYPAHDPWGGHSGSNSHLHIGFGGSGGTGGAIPAANAMADISGPNFGKSLMGGAYNTLVESATAALQTKISGQSMGEGFEAGQNINTSNMDKASPEAAKAFARGSLAGYGWGPDQWSPLEKLWTRESGWRWNADNPSSDAFGIAQSNPGSKMASAGTDWQTNAGTQINWGLDYIKGRYQTPAAAWGHSEKANWYGNGGSFRTKKPHLIGVGEKGAEDVTITPARGRRGAGGGGGRGTTINSNIHVGTLIADDAGIELLAAKVGGVMVNDLRRARGATARDEG